MYAVADTHALIWYLLNDIRLSDQARSTFATAAQRHLPIGAPAISIVEIIYLVEKNRIPADALSNLQQHLTRRRSVIRIVPLNAQVAFAVQQVVRGEIPELADRIIAATALAYKLPLITRDHKIQASGIETIW